MQSLFLHMLLFYHQAAFRRLSYILDWIFTTNWQISYRITEDADEFSAFEGPKINYTQEAIPRTLHIAPSGLLADTSFKKWDVAYNLIGDMPVLFTNGGDLGFDVFSAVFYMLSRYEEYLPFDPDEHGRFPAKASLAYQHSFLGIPVVEIWLDQTKQALKQLFPTMQFASHPFTATFSYDIDVAYQYRGKKMTRWIGGACKDLFQGKIDSLSTRIATLFDDEKDPWNVYGHLERVIGDAGIPALFFLPTGNKTERDKNIDYRSAAFKEVVTRLKKFGKIGLHPSYYAAESPELLHIEKKRLESVLRQDVFASRQHYLRFTMPDTLVQIETVGIAEEYSMAFPDAPGFRAGTCHAFPFYDLKNEKTTSLLIFPAVCMDYTFYQYLKLEPKEALGIMIRLMNNVKRWNGHFIPIFHNDLLALPHWLAVHDELLNQCKQEMETVN